VPNTSNASALGGVDTGIEATVVALAARG